MPKKELMVLRETGLEQPFEFLYQTYNFTYLVLLMVEFPAVNECFYSNIKHKRFVLLLLLLYACNPLSYSLDSETGWNGDFR